MRGIAATARPKATDAPAHRCLYVVLCMNMRNTRDTESPCQVLLYSPYVAAMIRVLRSLGRFEIPTFVVSVPACLVAMVTATAAAAASAAAAQSHTKQKKKKKNKKKKSEQHSDLFWQHAVFGLCVGILYAFSRRMIDFISFSGIWTPLNRSIPAHRA